MVCFRGCHIANHHAVVLWSCVLYFTTSPKWNLHCRVRDAATQRLQIRTNSASRKFASWCCGTLKVLDRQLRKRRWFAQNGNGGPNVGVHQCNKMCFFGLSWNHNRHRRHIQNECVWPSAVFTSRPCAVSTPNSCDTPNNQPTFWGWVLPPMVTLVKGIHGGARCDTTGTTLLMQFVWTPTLG